jgi:hypothetical protein
MKMLFLCVVVAAGVSAFLVWWLWDRRRSADGFVAVMEAVFEEWPNPGDEPRVQQWVALRGVSYGRKVLLIRAGVDPLEALSVETRALSDSDLAVMAALRRSSV